MEISSDFDGGNIEVERIDDDSAYLRIRQDTQAEYLQWFYFRSGGRPAKAVTYHISNAGECTYKESWADCRIWVSADNENWDQLDTRYDGKSLSFTHQADGTEAWYAYFVPYPRERRSRLLARLQTHADVTVEIIGTSVGQRPIEAVRIGSPAPGRPVCWIIARQHPGETMAEWCAEGLLEEIILSGSEDAACLRQNAVLYVVPNANPDGSFHGNTRANAAGRNLNREWKNPSIKNSPEIECIERAIKKSGVDFFIDIHGDETMQWCFINNAEGVSGLPETVKALREKYEAALARRNFSFQTRHGYAQEKPGEADLSIASRYVAETYKCLSMTLEQPFQRWSPATDERWSPELAKKLGADLVGALRDVLPDLRNT